MGDVLMEKVIIVEGKTDKIKVKEVIRDPVDIVCTNGTISITRLDELVDELYEKDVYILVDSDESGEKLRKQLKREFPQAFHLYVDKTYREVATAPCQHLAVILQNANIDVKLKYL